MSKIFEDPELPDSIHEKISCLNRLLDEADQLHDEIMAWYQQELESYDPSNHTNMEAFNPGSGYSVEYIDHYTLLEGLCLAKFSNDFKVYDFRKKELAIRESSSL